MTQIVNFRVLELTGATKEEALAKAPFDIMGDATMAYKSWKRSQVNGITASDKKQFMVDYLNRKTKNVAGVGFVIVDENAVVNTRECPYVYENMKNEKGSRKYKTVFQLIDENTGQILATAEGNKKNAREIARQLYTEKDYRGDLKCVYSHQVVSGEPIAFKMSYAPSKNTKPGAYTVFGISRD